MDKLNSILYGGFPFELDDLRWHFDGIDGAFKGIGKGLGDCILVGCAVTPNGSNYDVTPGYIYFDGEVREYLGDTNIVMSGGPVAYGIVPADTLDPSGSEVFEDASSQNAYLRRRAIVGLAGDGIAFIGGPSLADRIRAMAGVEVEPWRVVGAAGQPPFENGYTGGAGEQQVMFRKENGGVVRFRGLLNAAAVAGGNLPAFTLPEGYRPAPGIGVATCMPRADFATSSDTYRTVYVLSAGSFIVHLPTAATSIDIFNLGGAAPFFAAQ